MFLVNIIEYNSFGEIFSFRSHKKLIGVFFKFLFLMVPHSIYLWSSGNILHSWYILLFENSCMSFELSKTIMHPITHNIPWNLTCSREQPFSIPYYPDSLSYMILPGGRHLAQESLIYSLMNPNVKEMGDLQQGCFQNIILLKLSNYILFLDYEIEI